MVSLIYLICIKLAIFQTVYTQCANRVVQGPNGPIELLPNQVLVPPSGVPYLGSLLPPSMPLPPPGRVYLPSPNPPCKAPTQSVIIPGPGPGEYANIANLGPVIANLAQLTLPNVLSGNVIVPNIASGVPNIASGNIIVPNTVSGNIVVPNAVSGNVVVPNAVSGNVVVPNAISGNIVVPNAVSGNIVAPNGASGNLVLPASEYAPTIIHDNSVANSLANALQLLVVSSLLGNTLPGQYEPPYYEGYVPGLNYIY